MHQRPGLNTVPFIGGIWKEYAPDKQNKLLRNNSLRKVGKTKLSPLKANGPFRFYIPHLCQ